MQPELSAMTPTPFASRLARSKPFAWWTLVLWALFVLSVILGHMALGVVDYLVVSRWVAAAVGIAAGVTGVRGRGNWLALALLAAAVLVVSSGVQWSLLIERLLPQDERNAVTTVLQRIWLMASGGLQAGIRDGMAHWVIATVYREMVMPILQLLTLMVAACLWVAMRRRYERRT